MAEPRYSSSNTYKKVEWENGKTPINADNLNKPEDALDYLLGEQGIVYDLYNSVALLEEGVEKVSTIEDKVDSVESKVDSALTKLDFVSVKDYLEYITDDTDYTEAFNQALSKSRVVYVPGGTYTLTEGIVIRPNCCLEFAQDAVLNFRMSNGNCISLSPSACIKGNHATINVQYNFEGNVINYDTTDTDATTKGGVIPPFKQNDPMFKFACYVSDINICKVVDDTTISETWKSFPYYIDVDNFASDYYGSHSASPTDLLAGLESEEDRASLIAALEAEYNRGTLDQRNMPRDILSKLECKGTALSVNASVKNGKQNFSWGPCFTGIKIAGAFHEGAHFEEGTEGSPWIHELRFEAFIEYCEIGVTLKDVSNAWISAIIQPQPAAKQVSYDTESVDRSKVLPLVYAKHGIVLENSKNVDMSGSRIWDWGYNNTLYVNPDSEYKPYKMMGDCRGAVIYDFDYYSTDYATHEYLEKPYSEAYYEDTRLKIHTDNDINYETLTIIQEPTTRWFRLNEGKPVYFDGISDKEILTKDHISAYFKGGYSYDYTNQLLSATSTPGGTKVYNNGKGYAYGGLKKTTDSNEVGIEVDSTYLIRTGFIPCTVGKTIHARGITFSKGDYGCGVFFYDENGKGLGWANTQTSQDEGYKPAHTPTGNDDFTFTVPTDDKRYTNTAYIRLVVFYRCWGNNPIITIDKEIGLTLENAELSESVSLPNYYTKQEIDKKLQEIDVGDVGENVVTTEDLLIIDCGTSELVV